MGQRWGMNQILELREGATLSPFHPLGLSAAPMPPSMASCLRPGSASDTTSTRHSEVWSGVLGSRVTGDLPLPCTKQLQWQVSTCKPQNTVLRKNGPQLGTRGSPWPGLALVVQGPVSLGSFPGPPGRDGGSGAWVVLGSPYPPFWGLQGSDSP